MENLGEALKMGFAIAFFVMALSLSMSSFSQANRAVNAIITARDRDKLLEDATIEELKELGYEQYVYVEPVSSDNLTRTVGIETVVSTINRAINENIEIHFYEEDGTTPLELYKDININGTVKGIVSCIDPIRLYNEENLGTSEQVKGFFKLLLGGKNITPENCGIVFGEGKEWRNLSEWENFKDKHKNKFIYWNNGLYNELKDCEFEERFGEYYQGTGATEIKKVVITYILKP